MKPSMNIGNLQGPSSKSFRKALKPVMADENYDCTKSRANYQHVKQDKIDATPLIQSVRAESTDDPRIFFKPLRKSTTKETIVQVLSQYGSLQYIRVPYSKQKGQNLGYGYVVFTEKDVGNKLLRELGQLTIDGKVVKLYRFADKASHSSKELRDRVKGHIDAYIDAEDAPGKTSAGDFLSKFDFEGYSNETDSYLAPKSAYLTRWSMHQVKPTSRTYYCIHAGYLPKRAPTELMFNLFPKESTGTKSYRLRVGYATCQNLQS